jgi:succinylglutamate desuccinylase
MNKLNEITNDIRVNSLISSQPSTSTRYVHNDFNSLINAKVEDNKDNEEVSANFTHQKHILQNQAYLNKIFLSTVA